MGPGQRCGGPRRKVVHATGEFVRPVGERCYRHGDHVNDRGQSRRPGTRWSCGRDDVNRQFVRNFVDRRRRRRDSRSMAAPFTRRRLLPNQHLFRQGSRHIGGLEDRMSALWQHEREGRWRIGVECAPPAAGTAVTDPVATPKLVRQLLVELLVERTRPSPAIGRQQLLRMALGRVDVFQAHREVRSSTSQSQILRASADVPEASACQCRLTGPTQRAVLLTSVDPVMTGQRAYTTRELTKPLGVSLQTVQLWVGAGHLQAWKTLGEN